jgi:hypothetical protein
MSLEAAINRNRIRQARFNRADKVKRQVILRIFDYEDRGLSNKADRVIKTCQRILKPLMEARENARRMVSQQQQVIKG